MSPFQHGEVFVTEDGAETDLDIGHYERFIDENLSRNASHSAGAIWDAVLRKERKGEFLGATVQVIPHITNEIKARIKRAAKATPADVVISEIGGTVGDIESLPFLEAIRQFRREVGAENVLYLHCTLVPFIEAAGELKTKPTQHSVNELRRIGIHPDVIVCRSHEELSQEIKDKIALFADVDIRSVVASPDVPTSTSCRPCCASRVSTSSSARLGIDAPAAGLGEWQGVLDRIGEPRAPVTIALVGKYVKLHDAYLSVHEALKHAGVRRGAAVRVQWVDAENMSYEEAAELLEGVDGVLVPGGFGSRGWEGRSSPARSRASGRSRTSASASACTSPSPSSRATSAGSTAPTRPRWTRTPYPVIDLLPEQKEIEDLGGTMRLGAQAVEVADGTRTREIYRDDTIHERHRHRYEVNNQYRQQLVDAGLVVSGTFQEGRLVEIVELDHPWFVASQFHPEFKSRPTRPAPLFREFVGAAAKQARSRSEGRAASRRVAPPPGDGGRHAGVAHGGADRVGRCAGSAITTADLEQVGEEFGFGLVGQVRLRFEGAAGNPPASVVVKLPSTRDDVSFERHVRELRPYRELDVRSHQGSARRRRRRAARVDPAAQGSERGPPGRRSAGQLGRRCARVLAAVGPFHARWSRRSRTVRPRFGGDP